MTEAVILDPWASFLKGRDARVSSQNGEDGVIAALFERIGTENKWCFEVGAADGKHLSNTWSLREAGWNAVLIEGDEALYPLLERFASAKVQTRREYVNPDSLDRILLLARAPRDLDLGVIDIDGNDYFVWEGMTRFRPRVMLVEFNEAGDGLGWGSVGGTRVWQAGFDSIVKLGKEKGYLPVAKLPNNVFFVDKAEAK